MIAVHLLGVFFNIPIHTLVFSLICIEKASSVTIFGKKNIIKNYIFFDSCLNHLFGADVYCW